MAIYHQDLQGKMNHQIELLKYRGIPSETAITIVDNEKRTIKVDCDAAFADKYAKLDDFITEIDARIVGDRDLNNRLNQETHEREQEDFNLGASIAAVNTNLSHRIDDIEVNIDEVEQQLSDERAARIAADNDLSDRINLESQRRADADTDLSNRVSVEKQERQDADSALLTRLQQEETTRQSQVSDLDTRLHTEATKRAAADTDLLNKINTEKTERQSSDNNILGLIADEVMARSDADVDLSTRINAEVQNRTAADTDLSNRLSTEKQERQDNESAILTRLQTEETVRQSQVANLDTRLNTEATKRAAGDTDLSNRLGNEKTARETADSQLQSDINSINVKNTDYYIDVVQTVGKKEFTVNVSQNLLDLISNKWEYQVCTNAENTPQGVTWEDAQQQTITGTLVASEDTKFKFYLVPAHRTKPGSDIYEEYITIVNGQNYSWEKFGETDIDLSNYAKLDNRGSDTQFYSDRFDISADDVSLTVQNGFDIQTQYASINQEEIATQNWVEEQGYQEELHTIQETESYGNYSLNVNASGNVSISSIGSTELASGDFASYIGLSSNGNINIEGNAVSINGSHAMLNGHQIATIDDIPVQKGYSAYSLKTGTSTAGAKGWTWSIAELNQQKLHIFVSQSSFDRDSVQNGDVVSIKAGYSWNFFGEIYDIWLSADDYEVIVTPYTPSDQWPSNFDPSSHSSDGYFWLPYKPGIGNYIIGTGAVAFGDDNKANEYGAFVAGYNNIADGRYSGVFGNSNTAGLSSIVGGNLNSVPAYYSLVVGYQNNVSGDDQLVGGSHNTVSGESSFAVGYNNNVSGFRSGVIGKDNTVTGQDSLVVGGQKFGAHLAGNTTGSRNTLVVGTNNAVGTDAAASFVAGWDNKVGTVSGVGAPAHTAINLGSANHVKSTQSVALGTGLLTNASNQVVLGRYNAEDSSAKLIIGNGTNDNNRVNALCIKTSGDVVINSGSSNLTVGSSVTINGVNVATQDWVSVRVPDASTLANGDYMLGCTVSNGQVVYSWIPRILANNNTLITN